MNKREIVKELQEAINKLRSGMYSNGNVASQLQDLAVGIYGCECYDDIPVIRYRETESIDR